MATRLSLLGSEQRKLEFIKFSQGNSMMHNARHDTNHTTQHIILMALMRHAARRDTVHMIHDIICHVKEYEIQP